jgi:hypothetical protein
VVAKQFIFNLSYGQAQETNRKNMEFEKGKENQTQQ